MDRITATMLLDYYGELLTDKQRTLCDCYFNQDLSFSEIAELEGISRQGVRDAITRAESTLQNYEDKTGYVAREQSLTHAMADIRNAAQTLLQLGGPAAQQAQVILRALEQATDLPGKETGNGI